jgi:hypothetical protein
MDSPLEPGEAIQDPSIAPDFRLIESGPAQGERPNRVRT